MTGVVFAVLGLALLLLLVAGLQPLAERLQLPLTTLLAGLGVALGLVSHGSAFMELGGPFDFLVTASQETALPAETFLYVFLPPLIFAAGLGLDVRLLLDEIGAVLLMAVVAVLVCTAVVGVALAQFTDIGLVACLLLGAIVATTDPAAVVAIFRDVGAPRRLTILVLGESLLNDAAAIAIFAILLGVLLGGQEIGIWGGLAIFVQEFLGGALLGLVLAWIAAWIAALLRESTLAEVTLTVSLAYLSFVLGEHSFGVSGVVAVAIAALGFSVFGRTRVAPDSWETLTAIWAQLEFWASSLIFLLAAMIAARNLPSVSWSDAGLLVVVVLATLIARALVLQGLLPALVASGLAPRVGPGYRAVMLWGGLRGAVTVTLAVAVTQIPTLPSAVRDSVLVLATGYVLFTLFVQAPTLRPMMRAIGLDRLSAVDLALRDRLMALTQETVRAETARIAQETGFDETSLETALGDAPSVKDADALAALSAEGRQRIGLIALANREKELILEHYRERMLSRGTVDSLLAAADRLRDRVRLQGPEGYKAASRAQVQLGRGFALALWVHRHIGWEGPLARRLARRFEMLVAAQVVQRELRGFATLSLRRLLGEATSEALTGLVEERRRILTEALDALEARYPAYAASLRAHYLTLAALRIEQDAYRRSFAESMISREVFADLRRRIAGRGAATRRRPPLDLGLDVHRMIGQVPLFARLPEKRLLAISRLLKPRLAIPGEYIVERGARGTAMYFIVSGQVSVRLPESVAGGGPVTLERGQFFGELSLITRRPRNADVIAEGYCHLLVLDARDFHKLLRSDESLKQEIESVAQERLKGPDDGEGLRTAVGED